MKMRQRFKFATIRRRHDSTVELSWLSCRKWESVIILAWVWRQVLLRVFVVHGVYYRWVAFNLLSDFVVDTLYFLTGMDCWNHQQP